MQFSKVNRSLSEKVFVSVQNVAGATITTGLPVAYQIGNSMDGVNAVIANGATTYPGFVGVASRDIANNDYGLVQIYGFVNSVLLSNLGTSLTVNAGDPLIPSPAGFFSSVPTYANAGFKRLHASNLPVAVSAVAYASALISIL